MIDIVTPQVSSWRAGLSGVFQGLQRCSLEQLPYVLHTHRLQGRNQGLENLTSFAYQSPACSRCLSKYLVNGFVRSKNALATIHYFEKCWKAIEIIFLSSWAVLLKIVSVYGWKKSWLQRYVAMYPGIIGWVTCLQIIHVGDRIHNSRIVSFWHPI